MVHIRKIFKKRTSVLLDKGPTAGTSCNLNDLLKALFPNMVTLEFRAPTYELMGHTIQSKSAEILYMVFKGLHDLALVCSVSGGQLPPSSQFISQFLKHAGFFPF